MIPEFGHFALILALFIAGAQTAPLLCRQAAALQFFLCLIAFAALLFSFMTFDFTVAAVAENLHTLQSITDNILAALSATETLALSGVLAVSAVSLVIAVKKPAFQRLRLLGVLGMAFIGFTLFIIHPFERIDPPPFDGVAYDPFTQESLS